MTGGLDAVEVAVCGPERAEEVHRLTQAAFGSYMPHSAPTGISTRRPGGSR